MSTTATAVFKCLKSFKQINVLSQQCCYTMIILKNPIRFLVAQLFITKHEELNKLLMFSLISSEIRVFNKIIHAKGIYTIILDKYILCFSIFKLIAISRYF